MRCLQAFEAETGVTATDCVIDDAFDRIIVLVDPDDMAAAIGPGGATVRAAESTLGRNIKVVQSAETPEELLANALSPAAVYDVTVETRGEDRVAVVDVDEYDRGVAIGTDGESVAVAKILAERYFDIDDVLIE